jgi:hypothetical protein
MRSGTSTKAILHTFVVFLFFYAAVADAILLRGAGRGSNKDTNATHFYLVENQFVNSVGLDTSVSVNNNSIGFGSTTTGILEAGSTPEDCYVYFFQGSGQEFHTDEPCSYEFYEQGNRLQLEGFSTLAFPAASGIDVTWTISQGQNSWNYSGLMDGNIATLDILMPEELTAGDYGVDLQVSYESGSDHTFFRRFLNTSGSACDQQADVCGYTGTEFDNLIFNSGFTELMRILPGSAPVAVGVSEPTLWSIFLLALAGLWRRGQRGSGQQA